MRRFGVSEIVDSPRAESPVQVRRLTYSDLPSVLSIERRAFPTPWSLAMFVLELSKPSGICLAATTDRGLSGYLICSRYADVWHLMNVAVMQTLFEEAGEDARYTLEVRTSNEEAIAMYRRFGFRPAGRRRRYYHDNGEDALIMWLDAPAPVGA
jgi:[ribosomal protein S18]-alanine N-acetyltransferase